MAALAALGAFAPPASAAKVFGPAKTVGSVKSTGSLLGLAVTRAGRIAIGIAGPPKTLYVATRGTSGGFGPVRTVKLKGYLPRFLVGGPITYLGLDESGRVATLEIRHENKTYNCCSWPAAVTLDSNARVLREQPLGPTDGNSSAIMDYDRGGMLAITTYSRKTRLAIGSVGAKLHFVKLPAIEWEALTYAGPGRFVVWLRNLQDDVIVASGAGDGNWSRRVLARGDGTGSPGQLRPAFGPGGRTLLVWGIYSDSFQVVTLHAAWLRDGKVTRTQTIASFADGKGGTQLLPAVDAAGRATVVWRDGNTTLRVAEAAPGGKFSSGRVLWQTPKGQQIDYLGLAGGGSGAVATWLAYPADPGADPATIRAARLRPGQAPGPARVLNTVDPHVSGIGLNRVALDAQGRGAVAWVEEVDSGLTRLRVAMVER
jgi:hypothetical protein